MKNKGDLEEFFLNFNQSVRLNQEVTGLQFEEQLFNEFSEYMFDAGEIDDMQYDHFQSANGRLRIDGWGGPISEDGQIKIFIVVTDQSNELETLGKKEIETEFGRLRNFVESCRKDQFIANFDRIREVGQFARGVNKSWNEISKIRLCIITDKKVSQRVDGLSATSIDGVDVVHSIWDIQRLADISTSGKGREEISIKLEEDFGASLPALRAAHELTDYAAYLLVLPGTTLARIFDRFDTRLLESNVRVFLQARGGVNKGIRDTIDKFPDKFLAFNNGITATASRIETEQIDGQVFIKTIEDLQIVNGGQTTASIHSAFRKKTDLSKIFVQMKLSVIGEVADEDLVSQISRYANSQNKVSDADFFSNHPYHKRFENFSRENFAPSRDGMFVRSKWFYERARGQYLDMLGRAKSKTRAESEYPKKQVLTKTDHAKYEMTFGGHPYLVSKGAQHNFKGFAAMVATKWSAADSDFDKPYFESALARAILFREGEKLVSDALWYDGGYRAQAVAYTWSKIAFDLEEMGKRIDFDRVWQDQAVSDLIRKQFLDVGESVYKFLFKPVAGVSNIGELTKKAEFWESLKNQSFVYNSEFLKGCVGKTHKTSRERRQAQVASDSIRMSMEPKQTWSDLVQFCDDEAIGITPMERGIIATLISGKPISDAQAKVLKRMFIRVGDKLPDRMNV